MKKYFLIQFLNLSFISFCFGQNYTSVVNKIPNDTFAIRIFKLNSTFQADTSNKIYPEIKYDFRNQYPFYTPNPNRWNKEEKFKIEISNLPSNGVIYVFSIDGENKIEQHSTVFIDSSNNKGSFHYPDSSKFFQFVNEGIDKLIFWYSTDTIKNVQKLIGGIELTYGNSVRRVNGQLGKKLLLPKQGWYFTDSKFGFILQKEEFEYPQTFVIPLIIEFNVSKKEEKNNKSKIIKK